ncbi:hypothetical protein BCR35DRAFT_133854 [Leucosporidium creatinivorum]|uniref:Uncharacterized protein n=1 Tax=Leucosporidium creatinivorum TaxID=106004 RepID=A0A1Y2G2A3_9BASI|nr:hypothetical protein BCR35DRAFT_133854 [Leucosporidium creatinivorum]
MVASTRRGFAASGGVEGPCCHLFAAFIERCACVPLGGVIKIVESTARMYRTSLLCTRWPARRKDDFLGERWREDRMDKS